ncbi:MAG: hypothetical protein R3F20_13450 [Planctomycetota bacterium]
MVQAERREGEPGEVAEDRRGQDEYADEGRDGIAQVTVAGGDRESQSQRDDADPERAFETLVAMVEVPVEAPVRDTAETGAIPAPQ